MQRLHGVDVGFASVKESPLKARRKIGLERRNARRIGNLVLVRHARKACEIRRVPRRRHDQRSVDDQARIHRAP